MVKAELIIDTTELEKKVTDNVLKELGILFSKGFKQALKDDRISQEKVPPKEKIGPTTVTKEHVKEIFTPEETDRILAKVDPDFSKICRQDSVAKDCKLIYDILKTRSPEPLTIPEIMDILGLTEASFTVKNKYTYPIKLLHQHKHIEKTTKEFMGREVTAYRFIER